MELDLILSRLSRDYVVLQSEHDEYNSIRIMGRDGNSFARLDIHHRDKSTACLNSLYVCDPERRKGIGTYLQDVREQIGIALGCTTVALSVKINTWMFDWYESRGYTYYTDDTDNHVFMTKELIQSL